MLFREDIDVPDVPTMLEEDACASVLACCLAGWPSKLRALGMSELRIVSIQPCSAGIAFSFLWRKPVQDRYLGVAGLQLGHGAGEAAGAEPAERGERPGRRWASMVGRRVEWDGW